MSTRAIYRDRRVGVLLGGFSGEKEISRMSGRAVVKALRSKGYRAIPIEVRKNLSQLLSRHRIEVVFNALHGKIGEDGCVQGLLEIMGIPYTGSGLAASALSMDKVLAKELFVRYRVPTPAYQVMSRGQSPDEIRLAPPLVVKPRAEGSTLGVTVVRRRGEIPAALARAFRFDCTCLVEKYIPGKEVAVAVLDGKALGAIEIRPRSGFYDFKTKYTAGMAEHLYPAPLKRAVYHRTLKAARMASAALGCEGAPRVDLRITPRGGVYVLEVNALPGLTPFSLLPEIARGEGIPFPDLVEKILNGAKLRVHVAR